jgi:hypothetical protein
MLERRVINVWCWVSHSQSCSFARNISGIPSSSMNTLLLRSPRATGGSGSVSALRADSRGTGVTPGAEGGGVRERDAAVRCSAVCTVSRVSRSTKIGPAKGRSEQGDDATYPCWMAKSAVVRRSICLTGDDIRRGTWRVRVSPVPYHTIHAPLPCLPETIAHLGNHPGGPHPPQVSGSARPHVVHHWAGRAAAAQAIGPASPPSKDGG